MRVWPIVQARLYDPRHDVDWIGSSADKETILVTLRKRIIHAIPAANGKLDEVVGIVQAKDILTAALDGKDLDMRAILQNLGHS